MKAKWAIVCILFLIMSIITIGCNKSKQSTKEEVYKEFQKKIYSIDGYTCKAKIKVIGNKSPHTYEFIHNYKKTNYYKLVGVYPKHIRGKVIEYKGDKIYVKNPNIKDVVELPNRGLNDQYLFIGDFYKNFLENEQIQIKIYKDKLLLKTDIPGDNKNFHKQLLFINKDTLNPEQMEILDNNDIPKFIVNYSQFKLN